MSFDCSFREILDNVIFYDRKFILKPFAQTEKKMTNE